MPAKWFKCPDGETIEIAKCLSHNGCRMAERCATRPFLRLVGYDREWRGVTPSAAGNGPRLLFLKAMTDYIIDPDSRVWAAFGTSTHEVLGIHKYSNDVMSEERFHDGEMGGTADVLEIDENDQKYFILTDYKTWGSYKVAKSLGIKVEKSEETLLDVEGNVVILKSGKNKGMPKTKKHSTITTDPASADLKGEELQLNRYRLFFEANGFPVSKIQIQAIPRDGGTWIAQSRGVTKNLYIIPLKRLNNAYVLNFYRALKKEVNECFKTGYIRKCNQWESWEGRRCDGYCEVVSACKQMSKTNNEKWGIL